MPNYIFVRKSVSEAVCKGYLEPLKERLDKESFFSCSVLPSSHFKTTLHTASHRESRLRVHYSSASERCISVILLCSMV